MKGGYGVTADGVTVAYTVAVGVGVAAIAGIAAKGALGAAMTTAASRRNVKPALRPEDVQRDGEGRLDQWAQMLKTVQQGGVAPEARADVWPYLLGVFDPCSTEAERVAELSRLRRLYTKLVLVCQELDAQVAAVRAAAAAAEALQEAAAPPPPAERLSGNLAAFAEAHRIIVMDSVRTDLRLHPADPAGDGGKGIGQPQPTVTVLPVSVGDGLPELMLAEPPEPRPSEAVATGRLPLWRSALATATIGGAAHAPPDARRLMMRLVNVLTAYAVHDPETGYCQGMSDLAAVFVQLFDDDALAFACFERLMRDARQNFKHDETGIRAQLAQVGRIVADTDPALRRRLQALGAGDCTFAYRMVVVMLRRELPLPEVLTLWEAKWATQSAEAAAVVAAAAAAAKQASAATTPTAAASASLAPSSASSSGSLAGTPTAAGLSATLAGMHLAATTAADAGRAAAADAAPGSRGATPKVTHVSVRTSGNGVPRRTIGDPRPPPDFLLQFVAAVVRAHRSRILSDCRDADDVLRLFNTVRIDFWAALAQARKQYKAYCQGLAVMQRL